MSRRYKGTGKLTTINTETYLTVKVDVNEINYLQRILESYENLAWVIPVDPKKGLLRIHTTPYLYDDLKQILNTLSIKVEFKT